MKTAWLSDSSIASQTNVRCWLSRGPQIFKYVSQQLKPNLEKFKHKRFWLLDLLEAIQGITLS
jgi:hypothetical protein